MPSNWLKAPIVTAKDGKRYFQRKTGSRSTGAGVERRLNLG